MVLPSGHNNVETTSKQRRSSTKIDVETTLQNRLKVKVETTSKTDVVSTSKQVLFRRCFCTPLIIIWFI